MKNKFLLILVIALIFGVTGCQKYFDINHDPDALEEAPLEMILPAALAAPLYTLGGDGQIIGAFWAQHWTQSTNAPQYQGYDSWQITNSTFDGRGYGALYFYGLKDLEHIRKEAEATENWTYYLIATATQSYVYQMLVDMYDQVPFSEALQGDSGEEGAFTPHFDDGNDIYDSLLVRLDYALSKDFTLSSNENPGEADIVFQGNINNWIAFANTLKLKILLRESFKNDVTAEINAIKDAAFLMNDASYDVFVEQQNKQNPMYGIAEDAHKGNITMSRTLLSVMIDDMFNDSYSIRDQRVNYLALHPKDVEEYHRALYQGDYINIDYAEDIGYLSRPRLQFDDELYYFTQAECYFLLAEADVRFWGGANAQEYYENGVTAAFKRFSYLADYDSENEQTQIDNILDEDDYGQWPTDNSDDAQLKIIWLQKWISMVNIQGMEAFIEHNRTDYPETFPIHPLDESFEDEYNFSDDRGKFTISVNNVTSDRFPRRLMCPQSEIDGNPNTPADLKNKKVYDKVWWDVN